MGVLLLAGTAVAGEIPWYQDGRLVGSVAPERAADLGLTVVDLSDGWAPSLLAPAVPYRATFLALANGHVDLWAHAREDRFFELFGIPPLVGLVRARLADADRHACHAAVTEADEVRRLQAHLGCDGLLAAGAEAGRLRAATLAGLAAYRRLHALPGGGGPDEEVRATLATDSRELDLRDLLRVLRERVADATGLIEDGSALNAPGTVLGRALDSPIVTDPDRWQPLPGGAPDRVSAATEAAALALGWTSPDGALDFFAGVPGEGEGSLIVAMRLPPLPPYHAADMPLRAEIDRGDARTGRHAALVLYSGDVALVRWPTTIGGWQAERLASGRVVSRFKASTPGDFVWRDVYAAPVWFPPPTTPDSELGDEVLGPGYRSAFGLVALVHERVERGRGGALVYEDTAVRTHGSVNYRSIPNGHSHGCHRLYNHLALRLGAFVLRHRPHAVLGEIRDDFERRIAVGGRVRRLHRESRGFAFRLDQPVPVRVLR